MVPIVPIVPSEGNTKPRPKQDSPKKRYCLTLNNWTENEYNNIVNIFSSDSSNKWIIGKEKGESGTPHLQIYISFATKQRFTAVKKICERFHIEPCRGNELSNINYCSKDGDYICQNIKVPKPLKKLACEDNFYPWQLELLEIIKSEPDDRTLHWITGVEGGNGKTTFCKYLVRFKNALVLSGKACDMKHAIVKYKEKWNDTPELILINIPKSFNTDFLSYQGIEEIKDMLFYSGKFEGDMIDGNNPHLFVFSNDFPDKSKMSKGRWWHRLIADNEFVKYYTDDL